MPITKNRKISKILNLAGKVKSVHLDSDRIVASANLGVQNAVKVVTSADTLPATAAVGDQAVATSSNRLYIYTGDGWYNIALINTAPYFTTSPNASYVVSNSGAQTNIEILAVDSEGINIVYTATGDSNFNDAFTIVKDSDNGRRFTVYIDSDQTTSASGNVTFKASDGVNFASAISSFEVTFNVTNSHFTSYLMKADAQTDNQIDSATGKTVSITGNVTGEAFSPYHPAGYSCYYNGFLYMTFAEQGDAYELGVNTSFTIETWIFITDMSAQSCIISQATTPNHTSNLQVTTGGEIFYQAYQGGSNKIVKTTSGAGITSDKWYHIAMTHEASNSGTANAGKNIFYVNGTEVDSVTNASYSWYNGTDMGNMEIGRYAYSNTAYFTGYIRDLRITKSLVYTSNFTAPTKPLTAITNCELLCMHMPYIVDGSTNDTSYAVGAGTPISLLWTPYDHLAYSKAEHSGSAYFDGTGDLLTLASSADFNLGDEYTIEMWVYQQVRDASEACRVFMCGSNGTTNGLCFSINSAGQLDVGRPTAGGVISNAGGFIPRYTWNHLAVVKQGSTATGYINGNYVTHSSAATTQTAGNQTAKIGYDTPGTVSEQFYGFIHGVHIIKGRTKYPLATSAGRVFTPTTSPYSADSDAVLLTCTNRDDIFEVKGGYPVTQTGGVASSTTQRKFTTSSSIFFDGSNDRVDMNSNRNTMRFESGTDFTVECWVYMDTVKTRNPFIAYGTGINGSPLHKSNWSMYHYDSKLWWSKYDGSTSTQVTKAWTPSADTWYHVAVSRASGNLRFFIDGTQIGTTETSNTVEFKGASDSDPVRMGYQYIGNAAHYLHGYIQDPRITKGLGRYTANFTAPTAEFEA